jgi:hypothetical protein
MKLVDDIDGRRFCDEQVRVVRHVDTPVRAARVGGACRSAMTPTAQRTGGGESSASGRKIPHRTDGRSDAAMTQSPLRVVHSRSVAGPSIAASLRVGFGVVTAC